MISLLFKIILFNLFFKIFGNSSFLSSFPPLNKPKKFIICELILISFSSCSFIFKFDLSTLIFKQILSLLIDSSF